MILKIPSFDFNIYAAMLVISVISGLIYFFIKMKKTGIDKLLLTAAILTEGILIFYFGAVMSFIMNSMENASLLNSGFTSTGGAIGVIISSVLLCFIFKAHRKCIIESNAAVIPLIYSISKTGCFFAGCCHGRESEIFAVKYPEISAAYQPVQLYETIVFLVIFIYITKSDDKLKSSLILCCSAKFLLDFLRAPVNENIISANQIVCFLIFTVGMALIKVNESLHKPKRRP